MNETTMFNHKFAQMIPLTEIAKHFKNNPLDWEKLKSLVEDEKPQKLASADTVKAWHKSNEVRSVKKWG